MKRRNLLQLLGVSPAIAAGAKGAAASRTANQKVEGLNPRGIPPAIQLIPMAPRLATLVVLPLMGAFDCTRGCGTWWWRV
jgi:hypothetical protein